MNRFALPLMLAFTLIPFSDGHSETLEEAWVSALSTDQSLRSLRSQTAAAQAQLAATKASRMPTLELDGAFTQLDDSPTINTDSLGLGLPIALPSTFDDDNFLTGNVQVSVPLYTSGLISSGIKAARASREASMEKEKAFVEDVKLAVADAYVLVLRAGRALDVANSNVESLDAHVVDVENMFSKGLVPQNDLLAVQVSLANARQTALQASNGLDVASAAYNRRLGRELAQSVTLEEVMPPVASAAKSDDLSRLTADALTNRSELNVLINMSTALRQQSNAERASTKPQLGASAAYSYFENELLESETFTSAGISVTWSLFDGGRSGVFVTDMQFVPV